MPKSKPSFKNERFTFGQNGALYHNNTFKAIYILNNMKRKKIVKNLYGLERLTEFIKIILASSYVDGEKPLSLMIVAPVSSGKTTAIKQFSKNPNISIMTDLTAYGVLAKSQDQLRTGKIRHIIIPDFLNALARKKTSVETLLMFINASSEDGLFPSKTFAFQITDYIEPFGWILCLTEDGFEKKKNLLTGIGFVSRFFIIKHKYSLETIQKILQNIINEDKFVIPEIKITDYKIKKKILGNNEIFKKLEPYSKVLCKDNPAEILRMQRKLQTFLKASALLRKDNKVNERDLKKLEDLIDLIK